MEDLEVKGGLSSKQVLRDTITVVSIVFAIEIAGILYSIYTLGLYNDGRWSWFALMDIALFLVVLALGAAFGIRWAREVNVFGELVRAGLPTTNEHAMNAVRGIFEWPRKAAIFYALAHAGGLAAILLALTALGLLAVRETIGLVAFKFIAIFCQGVVVYYAGKLTERPMLSEAVGRLLSARVYEWPHFQLKVKYKIFGVVFMVVAYLLCSAVLMGFSQARQARMDQLEADLGFWLGRAQASMPEAGALPPELRGKVGESSSLALLSPEGVTLSDEAGALSAADIEAILGSGGNGRIVDNRNNRIVLYRVLPGSGAVLAASGQWSAAGGFLARARNDLVALLLAGLLLSVAASYILVNDINHPLGKVLDFLRAIAEGETDHVLQAYSEDEFGEFSIELARTTDLLKDRNRTIELLHKIETLSESIEINCAFTQSAAEDQAAGASEQETEILSALQISDEIAVTARNIAENAESVLAHAEENLVFCGESRERLDETLADMESMSDFTRQVSEIVVRLGEDMKSITLGMAMIEEVADQLSLLSLNAELEAVGAGETGHRFQVVAKETSKLCERALASAASIRDLVDRTSKSAERAGEIAAKGIEMVTRNASMVDEIHYTVREIDERAKASEDNARNIAIITAQQKAACEEMLDTFAGLSASAVQIRANADTVLGAMGRISEVAVKLGFELGGDGKEHAARPGMN